MDLHLQLENPGDIERFRFGVNSNDRALCHLCRCLITIGGTNGERNCSSGAVNPKEIVEVPYLPDGKRACWGFVRSTG